MPIIDENTIDVTKSVDPTLELTCELISRASVTPEDAGCQALIAQRLEALGFHIEHLRFDDVDNLWAIYGDEGPILAFAGHTDVVPPGDTRDWQSPPFFPTQRDGLLYGRGAADMKGSLAAMVVACEHFLVDQPKLKGRIAFLITSDEEGPAKNGTVKVVEWLEARNEKIRWCLVGEPSSTSQLGDIVKNGRRGSLNARLTVRGKQGHVAYPHLALNPIHLVAPALTELVNIEWDKGNDFFPATSFQISNLHSGTGATNVVPGSAQILFNFRFSTAVTDSELKAKTESVLDRHQLNYEIEWQTSGQPFLTADGELIEAARHAINEVCERETMLSTSGGTSDGRFIAPTGAQVLELGPINATIHQIDECVRVDDLKKLRQIYQRILTFLM